MNKEELYQKVFAEYTRDYMYAPPSIFHPVPLSVKSIMEWIIDMNKFCSVRKVSAKTKKRVIREMKMHMRGDRKRIPDFVTAYKIGEAILREDPSEELDLRLHDPRKAAGFDWWKEHLEGKDTDLKELDFENPLPCIAFLDLYYQDRQDPGKEQYSIYISWYA